MTTQTATTKDPLNADQKAYINKEAEKLNKELEKLLEETRTREKYSITIIGGIAAFIFLHTKDMSHSLLTLTSFIPIATTLFLGASTFLLFKNIKWIATYLLRIEDYFLPGQPHGFGWEKEFHKVNGKSYFVWVTIGLWIAQLVLACGLFGYVALNKCL